jgi:hypothetical protein
MCGELKDGGAKQANLTQESWAAMAEQSAVCRRRRTSGQVEIPQLDHGGEGSRSQRYLEFGIGDKWLGDGEFGQQLLQIVLCWCVAWTSAEPCRKNMGKSVDFLNKIVPGTLFYYIELRTQCELSMV